MDSGEGDSSVNDKRDAFEPRSSHSSGSGSGGSPNTEECESASFLTLPSQVEPYPPTADRYGSLADESEALEAYCRERIQHLTDPPHQHRTGHQTTRGQRWSHPHQQALPTPRPTSRPVPLCIVATLKQHSFVEAMRQAASVDVHQPSLCTACQGQQAKLAMDTFIRTKSTQLRSLQLQEKLYGHICNNNSISLTGELVRSLPKASDDPAKIWQTLLSKERRSFQ